jgi:hypothetical protein
LRRSAGAERANLAAAENARHGTTWWNRLLSKDFIGGRPGIAWDRFVRHSLTYSLCGACIKFHLPLNDRR